VLIQNMNWSWLRKFLVVQISNIYLIVNFIRIFLQKKINIFKNLNIGND